MKDVALVLSAIGMYFFLMKCLPEIIVQIIYKKKWLSLDESNEFQSHKCDYAPDSGGCTQCTLNAARAILENATPPERLFRF